VITKCNVKNINYLEKDFFIPKGIYHRVIKGQGDLVVLIEEF